MKQVRNKKLQSAMIKEIIGMYPTLESLQADVKAADSLSGAKHLITGGCFLVCSSDVTDFMRANGGDKRLSDSSKWESYVNNMGSLIYNACAGKMNIYQENF